MRILIRLALFALLYSIPYSYIAVSQSNRQLGRESAGQASARTALVIGNGKYTDAPLSNPTNDATDMAVALRSLGFEVFAYTDLHQTAMKRAIREFGAKLRTKGGVGLFYFAGHGVQVKGINYLIPIGAKVDTEEEVEYESVEAGFVLAQMESAQNGMNIVILDACRNNPFTRSFRSGERGLAQMNAPAGTLIAYSTAPGSVAMDGTGRNGTYTNELLRQVRRDGLSIEDVFKNVRVAVRTATGGKQTPWESSSLTGNFYFTGIDETATTPPLPTVQSTPRPTPTPGTSVPQQKFGERIDESMFTFDLTKCTKSGSMASCELTITNNDTMDKKLGFEWFENGKVFDDAGNEGVMDGWVIGSVAGPWGSATLIPGLKVRSTIRFKNIGSSATVLRRIELKFATSFSEGGNYATRYPLVRFTDIQLR